MGFNCGIVGLPNVGKSTLFNAVTNTTAAAAANYPFCTIEPNIGRVPVPDPRLDTLARIGKSAEDRADAARDQGHCRAGARRLQGRRAGQQVPGRLREVDAMLQVLRCFEDADVTHVEGSVDPLRDAELIETELLLADLESLERQKDGLVKRARGQDKEAKARLELLDRVAAAAGGRAAGAHAGPVDDEEPGLLQGFNLLDRQTHALRLQRRRGLGRRGQRADRKVAALARGARRPACGHLRGDRGRAVGAGRGREGRVPGQHGPGRAGAQPGRSARGTSCWAC